MYKGDSMLSKSTKYYRANPDALKIKRKKTAEDNKKPKNVAKRVELTRINRDKGTYGNGDNKDWSHKRDGSVVSEAQSKNRARKGRKA